MRISNVASCSVLFSNTNQCLDVVHVVVIAVAIAVAVVIVWLLLLFLGFCFNCRKINEARPKRVLYSIYFELKTQRVCIENGTFWP